MRVEVVEPFTYGGSDRKKGEQLDLDDLLARVFNHTGKTKPVEVPAPPKLETASLKAETTEDDEAAREQRRRKKYIRRDMRPEE